ncbi:methyltransferase domain-containing protein [Halomonas campisalis]|uniref:tRNA (guanine(46)-N(7))-methyltransferase n=1 Tax=Billgrantia campisalis TaxID=74661 RepID=A0ABS9PE44_9GAMM|nr:methyltransferase domain-containing protein [Halomonas campisalis]MCG6659714.1 methyltransferase domain-containing protein [Halomonas campisalis]MDR5864652.1 methyltransferase domain-containing protein [Halomonas campisalis]
MHASSRTVTTNQSGPHDDLIRRVERALAHPLRKPLAAHTRDAFAQADAWLGRRGAPLILDAGCGVGVSTRRLAERFPEHAVIGVDRSADRLARDHGPLPANALLVRADLVDFWRLALAADWRPQRHYLLYPNPYPKAAHLKMRWHGHPVFPALLALGGRLELRSNWRLYVEEFALAVERATGEQAELAPHLPDPCLTPFEQKYHASGQSLWRLVAALPHSPSLVPQPDAGAADG